ncbi:MAG TPA: hypothetical protein VNK04_00165, partial [Gemmataceae bacterium]|nr:hypothetical protein [Gemmataceae bacterium]
ENKPCTLRVTCRFDPAAHDFVADWEFLDPKGARLGSKSQQPKYLYELHKLCPIFYLSALRDAAREFHPRSPLWSRLLRNPRMPAEVRAELERELSELNERILQAEPRLQAQNVVQLAQADTVGIEALPARVWDIVEADTFAKVANDLGIRWFCLVDGDDTGAQTRTSRLPSLDGRAEAECLATLPAANMELFLCHNGLGSVYEDRMAEQKKKGMTAKPGDPDNWKQVLDCLPNKLSKEQLAIDAFMKL